MRGLRVKVTGKWPLLLALLAAGSGCEPKPPPSFTPPREPWQSALHAALARHGLLGVGFTIARRGQVLVAEQVGTADYATGRPVTADTYFAIGSAGKILIAMTLLSLVADGKVDLNEPLSTLAPEIPFPSPFARQGQVTLAHLLEHSHGVEAIAGPWFLPPGVKPPPLMALATTPDAFPLQMLRPPGRFYQYTNFAYMLVTYIIEKRGGAPYFEQLSRRILAPLGMTQTRMLSDVPDSQLALGHAPHSWERVEPLRIAAPAVGGLAMTTRDMGRLLRTLLGGGALDGVRVLPEALVKRAGRSEAGPAASYRFNVGFGIGFLLSSTPEGRFAIHTGKMDGYGTCVAVNFEQDLGMALMTNTHFGGRLVEPEAFDAFASVLRAIGIPRPEPMPAVPVSEALARELPGTYVDAAPLVVLRLVRELTAFRRITFEAGQFYLRSGFGPARRLIPVGPLELRYEDEPHPAVFLIPGAKTGEAALLENYLQFRHDSLSRLAFLWLAALLALGSVALSAGTLAPLLRARWAGTPMPWDKALTAAMGVAYLFQGVSLVAIMRVGTIAYAMSPHLWTWCFRVSPMIGAALSVATLATASGVAWRHFRQSGWRRASLTLLLPLGGAGWGLILWSYGLMGAKYWG